MAVGSSIAEKHKEAVLEILSLTTDGKIPSWSSFEKALHGNLVWLATEIMVALQAAPSGTGAAEPAAWGRVIDGKAVTVSRERTPANDEPLYATPPVRGDRERRAIIRLAEIHVGAWLKQSDPALQLIPTAARQDIRDFADAILSLPVQPGAGEREACDRTETIIERALNCHWITVLDRAQLKATLRIALDTEVEAGGPYLNNGWNRHVG
jgi:hypothetical protein